MRRAPCGTSLADEARQVAGPARDRLSQSATSAAKSTSLSLRADRLLGARKLTSMKRPRLSANAVLVGRDDRGVRNGQAERPAKQRHHRVPVGDAADRGRLGEGGEEAEPGQRGSSNFAAANTATQSASSAAAISLTRRSAASLAASVDTVGVVSGMAIPIRSSNPPSRAAFPKSCPGPASAAAALC